MEAASAVNTYLNAEEPWKVVKDDQERAGTVLWSAIQAISAIRVALTPYLPFSSGVVGEMLGVGAEVDGWQPTEVPGGSRLGEVRPLFVKLEDDHLDEDGEG